MRKLDRLIREALASCRERGHKMRLVYMDPESRAWDCKHCGLTAYVELNPSANGIEIGGRAVAQNCKGQVTQ